MGVHAGGAAQAAPVRQPAADYATGQAHGPQAAWKAQAGA